MQLGGSLKGIVQRHQKRCPPSDELQHLSLGFRVLQSLLLGHYRRLFQHLHRVQFTMIGAADFAHQKDLVIEIKAVIQSQVPSMLLLSHLSIGPGAKDFEYFKVAHVDLTPSTGAGGGIDTFRCHVWFMRRWWWMRMVIVRMVMMMMIVMLVVVVAGNVAIDIDIVVAIHCERQTNKSKN